MSEAARSHETVFIVLVLIVMFSILHPRIRSSLFSFSRQLQINQFIAATKRNNLIDQRRYWQLRDLYSFGSLTFPSPMKFGESQDIKSILLCGKIPLLSFQNSVWRSTDMLINRPHDEDDLLFWRYIEEVGPYADLHNSIIWQDNRSLIARLDSSTYVVAFVKTVKEMKNANGVIAFRDHENDAEADWVWVNYTTIKTH